MTLKDAMILIRIRESLIRTGIRIRICITGNRTDLSFETHYYGKEQNEYDGCGLGDGVEGHLNILEAPLGET